MSSFRLLSPLDYRALVLMVVFVNGLKFSVLFYLFMDLWMNFQKPFYVLVLTVKVFYRSSCCSW